MGFPFYLPKSGRPPNPDVKIQSEDGSFSEAHRVILAVQSPVLKQILSHFRFDEEAIITLDQISKQNVEQFLDFCYGQGQDLNSDVIELIECLDWQNSIFRNPKLSKCIKQESIESEELISDNADMNEFLDLEYYEENEEDSKDFIEVDFHSEPKRKRRTRISKPKRTKILKGDRYLTCDTCGKQIFRNSFDKHVTKCQEDHQKEICQTCGEELEHKYMKQHVYMKHTLYEKEVCNVCGKMIQKPAMKTHLLSHEGVHKEICTICGTSILKWNMKAHLEKHAR